jgi:nitrogen-specific signal transduction histidine kinase
MQKIEKLSLQRIKLCIHNRVDTGVEIPEAIKSKMVAPMFTIKAKVQGFGLPVIKRMTETLVGTYCLRAKRSHDTLTICLPKIEQNFLET